jgi:hypothetical protein
MYRLVGTTSETCLHHIDSCVDSVQKLQKVITKYILCFESVDAEHPVWQECHFASAILTDVIIVMHVVNIKYPSLHW